MEWLHGKSDFTPEMLSEPPARELIGETLRVLNNAISEGIADNQIPPAMAQKLDNSLFLFSGFKTYHELNDASRLLREPDGSLKPFHRFSREVETIQTDYNENYLRAEYDFAVSSSQMAARWADHSDGDGVVLQYRTAGDSLVRDSHRALHNVTLPKSDKFWDGYYPPNGWGCRCTAVEVRAGKYEHTDSKTAGELGREATSSGGKENTIFRFNPGKHGQVFPPKHPYYKAPKEVAVQIKKIVRDE